MFVVLRSIILDRRGTKVDAMVLPRPTTTSGTKSTSTPPSWFQIWWTAARPHTLTASLCPCLVAYTANRQRGLPLNWQAAWTCFCATVQLGTNLHNDYADYCRGADTDARVGQARATARGWLTPQQTCAAAVAVLSVTLASGLYLLRESHQLDNAFLWCVILSSVFNAFAYTGGPFPLGYLGLGNFSLAYTGFGDVFVFLYFGLVATWMLPYLLSVSSSSGSSPPSWDWLSSQGLYGVQVGLLATNILVVNNLRDRHTDAMAHKRTTAVRFGRPFSEVEYATCLVGSYGMVVLVALRTAAAAVPYGNNRATVVVGRLLPLLSAPVAWREFQQVRRKDGADLNVHVGGAAKVQTLFCILLSLGLCLVP